MFWKNFVELCNKNNTSPNAVAKSIGISSASVTYWKNGSKPRDTALQKIADYFNVSLETLLTGCKKESSVEPLQGIDLYLHEELKELTNDEKEKVLTFAKFTKAQRKSTFFANERNYDIAAFKSHKHINIEDNEEE